MPFVNDGFAKQDPAGGGGGGGSSDASDLTSGTLADARLSSGILNATYQHNQYVLTTGTSTAYVATPATPIALADGAEILCGIHAASGASPTLNVSGTGAIAIYKEGAAGLTAVGTGQLCSGPNIYRFTYNAGFGGWVVSSPLFLQSGDLPSHSHAASDTTSGSFNTARLADGTATAGYVPISDGDGTSTWGAPSASDSTKLPLAGGTMTGAIQFSGAIASAGAGVRNIHSAGTTDRWYVNVPTSGLVVFQSNGSNMAYFTSTLERHYVPVQLDAALSFSGTQTSAGASIANIFRDSTGDLNYNVDTGDVHDFLVNGTRSLAVGAAGRILGYDGGTNWDFGAGYNVSHVPQVFPSSARISGGSLGQITSNAVSGALGIEALNSAYSFISAGGIGNTLPEVVVHGLSETAYAGAIEVKAGGVVYASNGTWTNCFNLAKGTHQGGFIINDSLGDGFAYYPVSSTTIGTVTGLSTDPAYVNSGAEDATHIAFRISGGYLQVNVGTSIPSIKLAITFQGTVV